jgi:hypothetical protein
MTKESGLDSQKNIDMSLFTKASRLVFPPHILLFIVFWNYFSGVKLLGREADHSSAYNTKVKNASPYIFFVWYLIKYKQNFNLYHSFNLSICLLGYVDLL